MDTFDVTKADKVAGFQAFLYEIRDHCGGLVISLIIPESYKDLMLNPKLKENDQTQEFYLYGWYNQHSFPIYVDKGLTDTIYVVCNLWSRKVKIANVPA